MEMATVVFEHGFDKSMLEQIDTLRTIRLGLAEDMLANIEATTDALASNGLVEGHDAVDREELRKELTARVAMLRSRLQRPDVIYEDEISFFVELLDQENALEDALEPSED